MIVSQHRCDRATAYTHNKPYERLAGFVKSTVYFLDENIGRLTDEVELWKTEEASTLLGAEDCQKLLEASQKALEEFQNEKKLWTDRLNKVGACESCNGQGWVWKCIAQDESVKISCPECDGRKMSLQALAIVAAIDAKKKAQAAAAAAAVETAKKSGGILDILSGRKFR